MLPVPSLKVAQMYPKIPPNKCYQREMSQPAPENPITVPKPEEATTVPEDATCPQPKDIPPRAEDALTVTNPMRSQPVPENALVPNLKRPRLKMTTFLGYSSVPKLLTTWRQCFGSGFNQVSGSGSVFVFGIPSRRAKMTHKSGKFLEISYFDMLDVLFWELQAYTVTWTSFMEAWRLVNCSFWSKYK